MSGVVSGIPREAPLPRASAGLVLPDLYFLFRHNTSAVLWGYTWSSSMGADCSALLFLKYCKQERWLWHLLLCYGTSSSFCRYRKSGQPARKRSYRSGYPHRSEIPLNSFPDGWRNLVPVRSWISEAPHILQPVVLPTQRNPQPAALSLSAAV